MTDNEREFLETQLPALKNQRDDTANRIKILQERRDDLNKQIRGKRVTSGAFS